jgi:hypothetical protein
MRRERPLLAKEGNLTYEFFPAARNELQMLGSFTCPKVGTWERLFDFPSEGRHDEDFYIRKIRRLRPGLTPRNREPEVSMLTSRTPKPVFEVGVESTFVGSDIQCIVSVFAGNHTDRALKWFTFSSSHILLHCIKSSEVK